MCSPLWAHDISRHRKRGWPLLLPIKAIHVHQPPKMALTFICEHLASSDDQHWMRRHLFLLVLVIFHLFIHLIVLLLLICISLIIRRCCSASLSSCYNYITSFSCSIASYSLLLVLRHRPASASCCSASASCAAAPPCCPYC